MSDASDRGAILLQHIVMSSAPLEVLDESIGHRIHIIMRNKYEITGVLKSFDEFVNCILEDAADSNPIGTILLNGNNICAIRPLNK